MHYPCISSGLVRRVTLAALTAISILRIVMTYEVFTHTSDEPAHIAAGMEWLDRGTYEYEALHPPLARVSTAILPYLSGVHSHGIRHMWQEGTAILYDGGNYRRNLTLARLGILPYFIAAVILLWIFTRRLFGEQTAFAATALFTLLPPVLAHAAVATTDMAATAAFLGLCAAFVHHLDKPSVRSSLLLGAATATGTLCKFSVPFYFIPCAVILILLQRKRGGRPRMTRAHRARLAGTAVLTCFLIIWSGYRFSFGYPIVGTKRAKIEKLAASYVERESIPFDILAVALRTPVPMPEFFRGIKEVMAKSAAGHALYLLEEELNDDGSPLFFPVALSVKTPLGFLLLVLFGLWFLFSALHRSGRRVLLVPVVIAGTIMAVAIPSNINLGVRHILPIYPFLAMIGGYGAVRLWNSYGSGTDRTVAAALILWIIVSSAAVHPDYLAYFNEIGGSHPERILIDSDLDWGQDLGRLSAKLRELHVDSLSIAYFQYADLKEHDLPSFRILEPGQTVSGGWVAISMLQLAVSDGYHWLTQYRPTAKAGKSILIYHIPESPQMAQY